ncbi:MAG: stress protein, partial [Solirubrobacterales bacterium]
ILRLPWRRPVWITSGALPGDAATFAWSLATRFLAAVPPGTTGIEVIDPSGLSGARWVGTLDPLAVERVFGGGVAAGPAAGERIRRLLDLADLRRIGGEGDENDPAGPWAGGPPVRLVLVFDAATALEDPEDGDRLARLVEDGPPAGLPVILVESGEAATESVRTLRVRQACHNLPSAEDVIDDPWVAVDWTLIPDLLPDAAEAVRAPALAAHVAVTHARTVAGA